MPLKKKVDRRQQRTKRQLSHALVELIQEKRFDDITVQNVIDRADVGRSTFYTHFRDKEDLLQQDWEKFLDLFAEHFDWDKAGEGSFVPVAHLFDHLREAQPLYKGLVRSRKAESLFRTGSSYLSKRIEEALNARPKLSQQVSVPAPILANFLATELFSLLKWWLDHQMPESPERMDEIYHQLVNPAFLKK
jgi:AcrR family transcriptional regulator